METCHPPQQAAGAVIADAALDLAKADFAETAGRAHLRKIRAALASQAFPPGTLVAINVIDGDHVTGRSDLDVADKFTRKFGHDAIGWVAELDE